MSSFGRDNPSASDDGKDIVCRYSNGIIEVGTIIFNPMYMKQPFVKIHNNDCIALKDYSEWYIAQGE